jgi:TrmH family RNA methyltransferase
MAARDIENGKSPDINYLNDICSILIKEPELAELASVLEQKRLLFASPEEAVRALDSLYYLLLRSRGISPSDWDLKYKNSESIAKRTTIDGTIYLEDIRSPFNVGSVFRAAAYFGISSIILSPDCPSPEHPRCKRTAMGCIELVPWKFGSLDSLGSPVFALECGGKDISDFKFPRKGAMIIGSEELGVGKKALELANSSYGIVSINGDGAKGSLNLSVAAGIALYFWAR